MVQSIVVALVGAIFALVFRELRKAMRRPPDVDEAKLVGLLVRRSDTVASGKAPAEFYIRFTNTSGAEWILKAFVVDADGVDAIAQWTGSTVIPKGPGTAEGELKVAYLRQSRGTIIENPELDYRGNLYQPTKPELRPGITGCRIYLVTEGSLGRMKVASAVAKVDVSNPSEVLFRFAAQEHFADIPFDTTKLVWGRPRDLPQPWGHLPTIDIGFRSPTSVINGWERKSKAYRRSLLR